MDTISAGGTVAFAVECFENGILTEEDTGGLQLRWGDSRAITALVEKMAAREPGIGDLLADGVKKASERIGKGSERYAVHAGGQELPMHDPKIDPMLGTTYSADPTPGRHTTSSSLYYKTSFLWNYVSWLPALRKFPKKEEYEPSEAEALKNVAYTSYKMLIDGAGACYYAMLMGLPHFHLFDYLNHATGWERSPDDYMLVGRRIQTMRQLFNARQGVDMESFKAHGRGLGRPPLESGHNRGITLKNDEMVRFYRTAWGWDADTGYPLKSTITELGIDKLLTGESSDE